MARGDRLKRLFAEIEAEEAEKEQAEAKMREEVRQMFIRAFEKELRFKQDLEIIRATKENLRISKCN